MYIFFNQPIVSKNWETKLQEIFAIFLYDFLQNPFEGAATDTDDEDLVTSPSSSKQRQILEDHESPAQDPSRVVPPVIAQGPGTPNLTNTNSEKIGTSSQMIQSDQSNSIVCRVLYNWKICAIHSKCF